LYFFITPLHLHSVAGLAMKDGGAEPDRSPPAGSRGRALVGKLATYYENNCQKHCLLVGQSKNNKSSYQLYSVFQKKVHPCNFHDNNVK